MTTLDVDSIDDPATLRNKRGHRKAWLTKAEKYITPLLSDLLEQIKLSELKRFVDNFTTQRLEYELLQTRLLEVLQSKPDTKAILIQREQEDLMKHNDEFAAAAQQMADLEDAVSSAHKVKHLVTRIEETLQNLEAKPSLLVPSVVRDMLQVKEDYQSLRELETDISSDYHTDCCASLRMTRQRIEDLKDKADLEEVAKTVSRVAISAPPISSITAADLVRSRLPEVTFPTFNGNKQEWPSFWRLFNQLVDRDGRITEDDKVAYLRKSIIPPEGAAEFRHLQGLPGDYDKISDVLKKMYHNPRLVYKSSIESLIHGRMMDEADAREWHRTIESVRKEILNSGQDGALDVLTILGEMKLTGKLAKQWAKVSAHQRKVPDLRELSKYLESTADQYEASREINMKSRANSHKTSESTPSKPKKQTPAYVSQSVPALLTASAPAFVPQARPARARAPCQLCKVERHAMATCPTFNSQSVQQRKDVVKRLKLCSNCLGYGHQLETCHSSKTCRECSSKHHTMLHTAAVVTPSPQPPIVAASPTSTPTSYLANAGREVGILPTAIITIQANGTTVKARAILDVCSSASYVTSRLVQRLGAHTKKQPISTSCVGNLPGLQCELVAHLTIHPKRQHLSSTIHIDAHVSQSVAMILPTDPLPGVSDLPFLTGLDLADPSFHLPGRVDLLLGSEATARMTNVGQTEAKTSLDGRYLAADTIYGWIVQGGATTQQAEVYLTQPALNPSVFWETEEVQPHEQALSKDETDAIIHYEKTHSRDSEGRYIVSLPRKLPTPELGHSRSQAEKRFDQNRRTLIKKNKWEPFRAAVAEYGQLHHAEQVPEADLGKPDSMCYYLPMHGVAKDSSTTTKLRIVFDASARTSNGISLNDTLLAGPNQYPLTTNIILKFRRHNIGMTADISKMFREVGLDKEDRDLHRFIWRTEQDQLQIWRMTRVTFGVTSSPFLATQTLLQLALDHEKDHPSAAQVIRKEFYVDDCLTGAETVEQAMDIREQLNSLLGRGKMQLRKWRTNSLELQRSIPDELCEEEPDITLLTPDRCHKALGLHWDTQSDQMFVSTPTLEDDRRATKRQISSDLARTYDVMGWFAPAMVVAKLLLQEIWVHGLDWDEEIPDHITSQWRQWTNELPLINAHPIPRCYYQPFKQRLTVQLHGFSDASERAYGGVVYLRSFYEDATTTIALVTAKTKVSPTTPLTIPKLELCGSVLLSKIMEDTRRTLDLKEEQLFAWTDSTIVLAWLNQEPGKLKVFVSNRVSSICSRVPASHWNHVPTENNPADLASRGVMPHDLINNPLWWKGPHWLSQDPSSWPKRPINRTVIIPEIKKAFTALTTQQSPPINMNSRYSSLKRLVRISAWHLRFIHNARLKNASLRCLGSKLSAGELDSAEKHLIRGVQQQYYSTELGALQKKLDLPLKSTISSLHPILSKDGLLIVGGRLAESDLPETTKHPWILPKKSMLTNLIISQLHLDSHHAGSSIILSMLAQRFHVSGARSLVRRVSERCIPCRKAYARKSSQLMGQLPAPRATASAVFSHVGVDFAGPMSLKYGNPRKPRVEKAYICLFICLSTKAIHLEAVSDLSTEAFMATFQRFVSRRGLPVKVYSDNGTNFVGADRSLRQAYDALYSKEIANPLHIFMADQKVTWSHIPELAPHFGGLWESNIKSAKTLLRSIAGTTSLTYERLTTFLCQAEAILNSRPLVPLNAQPIDNELALTPGHFLVGRPLIALPDITNVLGLGPQTSRSKWNHCRLLTEHFWRQWTTSYLTTLNKFNKWQQPKRNIQIGDVVLVKDRFLFVNQWPLARVVQVHPGSDSFVRTATVQGPACGILKRPVVKLVLLMTEEDNVSPPPRSMDVPTTAQVST